MRRSVLLAVLGSGSITIAGYGARVGYNPETAVHVFRIEDVPEDASAVDALTAARQALNPRAHPETSTHILSYSQLMAGVS